MPKASRFPREKVLTSLLTLEANKGHLKWKVSDLARLSKVSRPLIYFHLGRTKKEILETGMALIGEEFFGLSSERQNMLEGGRALESLLITHRMFMNAPALAVLYLRSRTQPSYLQKGFINLETRYAEKIRRSLPHLADAEVKAVHALFHGLVTAPFADEETIVAAWKMLAPLLKAPAKRG
jgi:AcrR family transcriptional regulator